MVSPSYCLTVDRWSTFAWLRTAPRPDARWVRSAGRICAGVLAGREAPHARASSSARRPAPRSTGSPRARARSPPTSSSPTRRADNGLLQTMFLFARTWLHWDNLTTRQEAQIVPQGEPGDRFSEILWMPVPELRLVPAYKCQEPTFSGPRSNRRSRPFPDLRPDGETPANELSSMARQEGRILCIARLAAKRRLRVGSRQNHRIVSKTAEITTNDVTAAMSPTN